MHPLPRGLWGQSGGLGGTTQCPLPCQAYRRLKKHSKKEPQAQRSQEESMGNGHKPQDEGSRVSAKKRGTWNSPNPFLSDWHRRLVTSGCTGKPDPSETTYGSGGVIHPVSYSEAGGKGSPAPDQPLLCTLSLSVCHATAMCSWDSGRK